jgi:hypothetical protein
VSWLEGFDDDWEDPICKEWAPPEGVNPWKILRDIQGLVSARSDAGEVVSICTGVPVVRIRDYAQNLSNR